MSGKCKSGFVFLLFGLTGAIAVGIASMSCARPDGAALDLSYSKFRSLSRADQQAIVVGAIEHRLQFVRNLYCDVEVRGANYEYMDGKLGNKISTANGRNYRTWSLGDAIRTDCVSGGPSVERPSQFLSTYYDRQSGTGRGVLHNAAKSRFYGRIDVRPDAMTEENRYAYWLDGKDVPMGEYLFRYLLTHRDQFTISMLDRDRLIRLAVPWQPHFSTTALGVREFDLDPTKGLMPVHGKARWDRTLRDGRTDWRTEEFFVTESKLVGDTWMPIRLRELVGGGPLGVAKISVWETVAKAIVHGNVVPADLEIVTPPGTEIVDAIKGVTYVVGQEQEPTKVESLIGTWDGRPVPPGPGWWRVTITIAITVGVLVALLLLLLQRRFRKSVV